MRKVRSVRGRSGLASSSLGCHQGDGSSVLTDRASLLGHARYRIFAGLADSVGGLIDGGGKHLTSSGGSVKI